MSVKDVREHEDGACDPCDDPVRPEEPYELRLHIDCCERVVQRAEMAYWSCENAVTTDFNRGGAFVKAYSSAVMDA